MADLFLSYTHGDRERARPIVEMLETEGWTVWWDRGIEPGMEWLPELETEIADTRAVVVLWSMTSVKSEWVMREAAAGLRIECTGADPAGGRQDSGTVFPCTGG